MHDTGAKQPDSEESGPKAFELQIPADRAGFVTVETATGGHGKNISSIRHRAHGYYLFRLAGTSGDYSRAAVEKFLTRGFC